MNAAINLLDKYKKACSIASDNACAGSLGVSRQAVSKWRNGENHPDADVVEKMCEATGEPLARWLPLIEAERARSPGARRAWLRLAQVAAALAGVYLISQHGLDAHSSAAFIFCAPMYYAQSYGDSVRSADRAPAGKRRARQRLWYVSSEGFRDLRHSCLLTPKACARYLGVAWLNATKKLRPNRPKCYATSAKKLMPAAPTANKLVQRENFCLSF